MTSDSVECELGCVIKRWGGVGCIMKGWGGVHYEGVGWGAL